MSLWALGSGLAYLFYQVDKSMKNDEKAMRQNAKAAIEIADAENKITIYSSKLTEAITVNASRKNGILTGHFKLFLKQSQKMKKRLFFIKGKGIEELQNLKEIQKNYKTYIKMPVVSSGRVLTDSQVLVSFALRGIGGMMVHDSKINLETATRNLSRANAISAQIDSECIAMEAITKHINIVTELLEKLGMLYMKSIRNVERILKKNGWWKRRYSQEDMEAVNLAFVMTKLMYRIINTPLVDENGEIEKESIKVIDEGKRLLTSI